MATVRPAAAATPCWKALLNDWYDGRIDNTYALHCYTDALKHLPPDVQTYSSAHDDIERALQSAIAQARQEEGRRRPRRSRRRRSPRRRRRRLDHERRGAETAPLGPGRRKRADGHDDHEHGRATRGRPVEAGEQARSGQRRLAARAAARPRRPGADPRCRRRGRPGRQAPPRDAGSSAADGRPRPRWTDTISVRFWLS